MMAVFGGSDIAILVVTRYGVGIVRHGVGNGFWLCGMKDRMGQGA